MLPFHFESTVEIQFRWFFLWNWHILSDLLIDCIIVNCSIVKVTNTPIVVPWPLIIRSMIVHLYVLMNNKFIVFKYWMVRIYLLIFLHTFFHKTNCSISMKFVHSRKTILCWKYFVVFSPHFHEPIGIFRL